MTASSIATLDLGRSFIRALLFDCAARPVEGYGARLPCRAGAGPDELADLAIDCLDELHRQVHAAGLNIAAIGASAAASDLIGIGAHGNPVRCETPRFWLTLPEYLYFVLFARGHSSTSLVSASGLWNAAANDYDDAALARSGIERNMLAPVSALDQPACGLAREFAAMWPGFAQIPWYPALSEAACECAGAGAFGPRLHFAVGETATIRAIVETPARLQLDRRRFVLSETLDTGIYSWARRTLPHPKDLEARLESRLMPTQAGSHGLTISGGEIRGLTLNTDSFDIHHAVLESLTLHARDALQQFPAAGEILVSGTPLHSPAWMQMIADALARPVVVSTETEPASRGAALWALEQSGAIGNIQEISASTGAAIQPRQQQIS